MFSQALTLAVLAGAALAQTFSINTPPSIQQCQPAALSWTGGTAPYVLAAIPAGQVSAPALATIAQSVNAQTYSWTVNLAQNTAITIRITDSTGAIAYSSSLTVQAGSGSGCLTAGASSAASGASSASGAASSSGIAASVSSVSSGLASSTSAIASSVSAVSSSVAASVSSVSASVAPSSTTSRPPASSTAAASSSAAAGFAKASFNVPFLALAAALGCAAFGGFTLLA